MLYFSTKLRIASSVLVLSSFSSVQAQDLDQQLSQLLNAYPPERLLPDIEDVPTTDSPLVELGKLLFFSKTLSGNEDVACASCHHPFLAGGDKLRLPVGESAVDPDLLGPGRKHDSAKSHDPEADGFPNLPRHSPTTFNSVFYQQAMFYDGRVHVMKDALVETGTSPQHRTPDTNMWQADPDAGDSLLETQARFPVISSHEMKGFEFENDTANNDIREALAKRLIAERDGQDNPWLSYFRNAFSEPQANAEKIINFRNIQKALAAYQASQVFIDNDWFAYLQGQHLRLSQKEKEGAILFFTSREEGGYECSACHTLPTFTDESYHNIAIPQFGRGMQVDKQDFGRRHVSQRDSDRYKFRTPGLLNVEMTNPYSHTGAFNTLEEMVWHHLDPENSIAQFDFSFTDDPNNLYSSAAKRNTQKVLHALQRENHFYDGLTRSSKAEANVNKLVAFLRSLTDPCIKDQYCLRRWLPDYTHLSEQLNLLKPIFQEPITSVALPETALRHDISTQTGEATPASSENFLSAKNRKNSQGSDYRVRLECGFQKSREEHVGEAQFVEVGDKLGLSKKHQLSWSLYTLKHAQRVIFTGGIAVGDINNDCFPDIYYPTGDTSADVVYINQNGDLFADKSSAWGIVDKEFSNGAAFVDIDGDQDLDLFVSNIFSPDTASIMSRNFNPDFRQSPTVYLNQNSTYKLAPEYQIPVNLTSWSFSFADIDLDQNLDMLSSHWRGPGVSGERSNHLWLQTENTAKRFVAADHQFDLLNITGKNEFSFTGLFADFDLDNYPDIFMISDFENSQYFRNHIGEGFSYETPKSEISDQNGMGGAVADYDKDGDLDIFVTSIWDPNGIAEGAWGVNGNRLYENHGGQFEDVSEKAKVSQGFWAWGACFADFNNDSWPDIFHVNGFDLSPAMAKALGGNPVYNKLQQTMREFTSTQSKLFISNKDKTFTERAIELGITDTLSGRAVSCFDYDRDGDIDILISNHQNRPLLYENRLVGGEDNHFINITLRTMTNNSRAIGAKVFVKTANDQQFQQLQSGNSFLSSSPAELHFGLGSEEMIEEIKVIWPDKEKTTSILRHIRADQFIEIRLSGADVLVSASR